MAWSSVANSSAKAYNETVSYYELIMGLESDHKEIMNEKLCYKVYVHCPFADHHCIVLVDDKGLCECLTLELTVVVNNDVPDGQAKSIVAPKVQLYSGDVNNLSYKGKVKYTLETLSECAYQVLSSMGKYNVAFNNCQHFCNNFLEKIGLPGHMTDTTKIEIGGSLVAAAVGIGAVGYGLYRLLTGNSEEDTNKDSSKQRIKHT